MKKSKMPQECSVKPIACTIMALCLSVFMTACANTKPIVAKITHDSEWMLMDSVLAKTLTDSVKLVLFNPDSVKCYHIVYKDTVGEKDIQVVKNYIRDSLATILNESHMSVLQFLLLSNPANYSKDSILVQSPYLPTLEFQFQKQGVSSVSIVISTLDKSWQMLVGGKQVSSFNYVDAPSVERYCNYFINLINRKDDKHE